MSRMAWVAHASDVLLDSAVDVPPILGFVGPNVESTIENLEAINARFGCCYNELHTYNLRHFSGKVKFYFHFSAFYS